MNIQPNSIWAQLNYYKHRDMLSRPILDSSNLRRYDRHALISQKRNQFSKFRIEYIQIEFGCAEY